MQFNRHVRFLEVLDAPPDQHAIRSVPQFYRADPEMVRRDGGEFLRRFLDRAPLPSRARYLSIDTKVHMLMPGFHACIPGWHCDDFHRRAAASPTSPGSGAPGPITWRWSWARRRSPSSRSGLWSCPTRASSQRRTSRCTAVITT